MSCDYTPGEDYTPGRCPECDSEFDGEESCWLGRLLCIDCWYAELEKVKAEAVPVRRAS